MRKHGNGYECPRWGTTGSWQITLLLWMAACSLTGCSEVDTGDDGCGNCADDSGRPTAVPHRQLRNVQAFALNNQGGFQLEIGDSVDWLKTEHYWAFGAAGRVVAVFPTDWRSEPNEIVMYAGQLPGKDALESTFSWDYSAEDDNYFNDEITLSSDFDGLSKASLFGVSLGDTRAQVNQWYRKRLDRMYGNIGRQWYIAYNAFTYGKDAAHGNIEKWRVWFYFRKDKVVYFSAVRRGQAHYEETVWGRGDTLKDSGQFIYKESKNNMGQEQ